MNESFGLLDVLAGGFGALLGPALAMPLAAVALAGVVFAGVRPRSGHLAAALVLVVIFATATTTRGLSPMTNEGRLASLGILVALSWLVARREEDSFPWLGLASGLLLAALAILWRPDAYSPLLGALRGSWQSELDHGRLFLYHLATASGLGGIYLIGSEIGRPLPRKLGVGLWWALALGAGVLLWTGGWSDLMQMLLLRWPVVVVG